MSEEIWKDLEGYDSKYQVSNMGHVRSIAVKRHLGKYDKDVLIKRTKDISGTDNGNGYLYFKASVNGKRKNIYIHRVVAELFIPRIEDKNVVNHIDYNKKNNAVSNLEWCTQKENTRHSICNMRKPKSIVHTNTGEKYITKNKHGSYRVNIREKLDRSYKTLEEAIKKRDEILNGISIADD